MTETVLGAHCIRIVDNEGTTRIKLGTGDKDGLPFIEMEGGKPEEFGRHLRLMFGQREGQREPAPFLRFCDSAGKPHMEFPPAAMQVDYAQWEEFWRWIYTKFREETGRKREE